MARGHREDQGRVKVRIVEFELEGSNASIQESLRSLSSSLRTTKGETVISIPPTRSVPAALEQPSSANGGFSDPIDTLLVQPAPENGRPKQNADSKPRSKIVRSPGVLELDLAAGPVPLEQFCHSKSPDSDPAKYLVIVFWLKKYLNLPSVTVDHIHTCYRHMGWNTPRIPVQPLRDLKSRRQWLNKGEGVGEYAINHIGENVVSKMGS
jgi:hypothetical protein